MATDSTELGNWPSVPGSGRASEAEVFELVRQIGAEVAAPLSAALERVHLLAASGRIGKASLRALGEEITRARRVALTAQQIGRLTGTVTQNPSRIDLPQTLRDALERRGKEIEARGLEVRQVLKPAQVLADSTLMAALLNSLLDWAFDHCCDRLIHVVTDLRNWPVRVQLVCEFAWRPADEVDTESQAQFAAAKSDDTRTLDSVDWRLVERLAGIMGVLIERSDSPWQARVLFEFEQAIRIATPPMMDLPRDDDSTAFGLDDTPMAGHHVLVVSPRREIRNLIREAVRPMGLMVDYVTSVEEAREFCGGGVPHGVVFDEALPAFDALRLELQAQHPELAMLQVCDDIDALEVADSGTQRVARVGLHGLIETLPSALAYELARR